MQPKLNPQQQALFDAAQRVYEERWRSQLEATALGQLIALEPESGEYVLGKDFREVDTNPRARFGQKPVHIFRIGGGGAVRVGGAVTRGRVLGRV